MSRWSRVIIITPRAGGADGVSAVTRLYASTLAQQIGQAVGEVEIWSLDDEAGQPLADSRVRVRNASGSRARFAAYALAPGRVGTDTLVIVQHVHLLPMALPLAWRGASLLAVLHGVEAWKPLRVLERLGCRAAWKIAAVSAHTAARFRQANPWAASVRVDVCPPGLPWVPARSTSGTSEPVALIVGRMAAEERYKGHDALLEIWPSVRRAAPGATLVIVGGGDDCARLQEKAHGLGLDGAVRFEGVVPDERLAALYREARVFVMPSANEGFGLVYIEAMSAGIPCIVASGAAEEIVEHGITGLVVPPGDAAALADALVRTLTSHDERDRMGTAAAAIAGGRFGPDAFAARFFDLLQLPAAGAAC